jgi:hypothetical protein
MHFGSGFDEHEVFSWERTRQLLIFFATENPQVTATSTILCMYWGSTLEKNKKTAKTVNGRLILILSHGLSVCLGKFFKKDSCSLPFGRYV